MSFEANNFNSTATIKLKKLDHIPTAIDLSVALEQSRQTTACVIELPWKAASSPSTYVLRVSSEESVDEANWVLHRGETLDAAVLWSFDSDDISLIESLIIAECDSARELGLISSQPVNDDINVKVQSASSLEEQSQQRHFLPNLPKGIPLDLSKIEQSANLFKDKNTGVITEQFFLYFLKQEFERYCFTGSPFALVLFRIRVDYGDGKIGFLPERAAQEAVNRSYRVLRSIDFLGYYQENKYAILLPGSSNNGGVQCVQSLEKTLLSEPLQPGIDPQQLRFSAGIASVPDTCDKLEVVLAASLDALKQSAEGTSSLVVFSNVSSAR